MVWSNQAVDKITIPASVPIGGAQDGVILSGYDIPAELQALHITAVVIFQRGDYPSEGVNPEAKYYFMGLTKIGYNNTGYTLGTVVDTKTAGLVAVDNIDLPIQFHTVAVPGQGNVWTASSTQFQHMDFTLGWGDHSAANRIRTRNSVAHAGQTLTAASWYNISLNSGWTAQTADSNQPGGIEWKVTVAQCLHLRGGVVCNPAPAGNSVLCNIGTNDYFNTFPDKAHNFTAIWYAGASNGQCHLRLYPNGDLLLVGGTLPLPPINATVLFGTVCPV